MEQRNVEERETSASVAAASVSAAPSASAPPSDRLRLAELGLEAALKVKHVAAAHSGRLGTQMTFEGGRRVPGVRAVAAADGRYAVELHLSVAEVSLPELAEKVRDSVERAAKKAGLAEQLGSIDVSFEDLVEDEAQPTPASKESAPSTGRRQSAPAGAGKKTASSGGRKETASAGGRKQAASTTGRGKPARAAGRKQ